MNDVTSRLGGLPNVRSPGSVDQTRSSDNNTRGEKVSGPSFREQLESVRKNEIGSAVVGAPQGLKFSNHAIDRMQARGIKFSPDDMTKIESAIGKAQAKGAKNTLLLTDAAALIVSVKDKNVVTVMDKASLKENVFTNIDSTVVV